MKHGRLLIISHTEHYLRVGRPVGWGPTVREIDHLLEIFDTVTHIAVLHPGEAPPSALPYASDKVRFVPLRPSGGPRLTDKLKIILRIPEVLRTVSRELHHADVFQFRAPTGMGVYLIPWLQAHARIPGWFKYAGNWMQPRPPWGYSIQKYWLTRSDRFKVTINGRWPGQSAHCLSFENPCLDEEERRQGAVALAKKDFEGPLQLCFVGHQNEAKGMDKLLEALPHLPPERITALHLIGDGQLRSQCEEAARCASFPVYLHGYLGRADVARIMAACHLLVLPSRSEGFPKVVAEAANYGCVPVVSDVSAIGQYIRHGENGFLLAPERLLKGLLAEDLKEALYHGFLKEIAGNAYGMAKSFTFEAYCRKLGEQVLR